MDQEPPSDPGRDIHTIPEPRDQAANRRRKGSAGGRPVGFHAARYDEHARTYAGALDLAALLTRLP